MIDLTDVVSAIITLILTLITTFLIPYLKTKIEANKFEKIKSWVKIAVEAAEMIYVGTGRGEEKKNYVIQYLNSKGYTIDTESINNLIESAVLEMKTK